MMSNEENSNGSTKKYSIFTNCCVKRVESFEAMQLKQQITASFNELYYKEPTELQRIAIGPLTKGENVYLQCYSGFGMGKRVTMAIGILQLIDCHRRHDVQALVVTRIKKHQDVKTSSFATQRRAKKIQETIQSVGKYMNVKCQLALSGFDIKGDVEALAGGAHVVVGTAGRIHALLQKRIIDPLKIKMLVLDEADDLIAEESYEMVKVLEMFGLMAEYVQVILIGSRLTESVSNFLYNSELRPYRIAVDSDFSGIKHFCVHVNENSKGSILRNIVDKLARGKCVVFTRTSEQALELAKSYNREGSSTLHFDHEKAERYAIMHAFLNGEDKLLFATDNLPYESVQCGQITLVINYDFPTKRNYAHRFCRAGFGDFGIVISLVEETDVAIVQEVNEFYSIKMQLIPLDCVSV